MKNKRIVYAMLALVLTISMLACNAKTEETPTVSERNAVMVDPMYGFPMQACGGSICYRHPDTGMTIMTNRQGEWATNTVLEGVWLAHIDDWNGDLIYCAFEDDAYGWYVYHRG